MPWNSTNMQKDNSVDWLALLQDKLNPNRVPSWSSGNSLYDLLKEGANQTNGSAGGQYWSQNPYTGQAGGTWNQGQTDMSGQYMNELLRLLKGSYS